MKITNILPACSTAAIVSILVLACVKETGKKVAIETTDFSNRAFVQVYNATLNSTRNYVYVDAAPVTGAALAYAGTFPLTPANFSLPEGFKIFLIKDTLSTSTQTQISFPENLFRGKNYTIFMYDTLNAAKQITVLNDIQIPTDTTARVRFANFIFSKTLVPAVDIFSLKKNANVFTNVQTTQVSDFIPYASALSDTLYVRETGTTNLLATLNGFNPTRLRSYTLIFRGRYQTPGTTGVARILSSFANN